MSKKKNQFPTHNVEFVARLNDFFERKPNDAQFLFGYYMSIGAQKRDVPFPPEDEECVALARAMREDVSNFLALLMSNYLKVLKQ